MRNEMMNYISLVDCNNFYVSCERVFNPALEGRPVVVLSNNDGCVIARSQEAKQIGIGMAVPAFMCMQKMEDHGGALLSSNYALYGDMSRRVLDVLSLFTPDIEPYSIDESFLALIEGRNRIGSIGQCIKNTVKQWTGIPVSVGISSTKVLAKVANKFVKTNKGCNGVMILDEEKAVKKILETFPVGDVWGIGPSYERLLKSHGIETALDLVHADDRWIRKNLTIVGLRIVHELRGIPCLELDMIEPPRKSICSSRSFGRPVESLDELSEALSCYAFSAASKLRRYHLSAATITVFIMTNRFGNRPHYSKSATANFEVPTSYTPAIAKQACLLLKSIFRKGYSYKKAGIILSNLVAQDHAECSLFVSSERREKEKRISRVIDSIEDRFGRGSLIVASQGIRREWKMHRGMLSPSYTTKWEDIPIVNCNH
jgi:DNA polymerase V